MKLKNYPGIFLHGLDLEDWYACHNISLDSRIWSPDFSLIGFSLTGKNLNNLHTSLRDIKIEDIKEFRLPSNFPSPRVKNILYKAIEIKRALREDNLCLESLDKSQKEILKLFDIEVKFEEIRRLVNPNAASRLCCLWVTENNKNGKQHLKNMLGQNIYIFKVFLPAVFRVTKADTKWFDAYYDNPKEEFVKNYWTEKPYSEKGKSWEYLVEGIIQIVEEKDKEFIRNNGKQLPRFLNKHLEGQPTNQCSQHQS